MSEPGTRDLGTLLHVCVSAKKGICKQEVNSAKLAGRTRSGRRPHAGGWHRQVAIAMLRSEVSHFKADAGRLGMPETEEMQVRLALPVGAPR